MKINKYISVSMALTALAMSLMPVKAQINSPYSRFGYGLLDNNATAAQRQMGGVGYAMNSGRQINVMNPASYAAADSLTFLFDMGLDFAAIRGTEATHSADGTFTGNISDTKYGGGLDYITMQIPLGKRLGASFGLVPYSSVGYAFGSEIANGLNQRQGNGGINQLYLGVAGRIFKGFSLGVNASYMFGNIVNDNTVYNSEAGTQTLFEQVLQVRDYHIQLGAQYVIDISPKHRLNAGVVWSPRKSLMGKGYVMAYDINADKEPTQEGATRLHHRADLAESWGGGLSYTWRKSLSVEADFTYQPWSKVRTLELAHFDKTRFADRYQLSVGASWLPSQRGNYMQRITYRLGGFYNRDYMMVGSNHVREYGVGVGVGIPALASKTLINVGFEWRQRQATPMALLKENYFNIRLGINFNELWFFQNKIK